jgi:hypothetical protein
MDGSTHEKGKKSTRMRRKEQAGKKIVLLYNGTLFSLTSISFSTILN